MIRTLLANKMVIAKCKRIAEYLSDDKNIAEDILQTAFLEILERSEDIEIDTPEALYKIFRSKAYNALRRLNKELSRYNELTEDISAQDNTGIDVFSYISRLPGKLRDVLDLIARGYTEREAAEFLNISQQYVSKLKIRGINTIKNMVESEV